MAEKGAFEVGNFALLSCPEGHGRREDVHGAAPRARVPKGRHGRRADDAVDDELDAAVDPPRPRRRRGAVAQVLEVDAAEPPRGRAPQHRVDARRLAAHEVRPGAGGRRRRGLGHGGDGAEGRAVARGERQREPEHVALEPRRRVAPPPPLRRLRRLAEGPRLGEGAQGRVQEPPPVLGEGVAEVVVRRRRRAQLHLRDGEHAPEADLEVRPVPHVGVLRRLVPPQARGGLGRRARGGSVRHRSKLRVAKLRPLAQFKKRVS